MAILQVHQATALKDAHEGSSEPRLMQEMRTATDFALWATKVKARALSQTISTLRVQECHFCLNLAEMWDADKVRFLSAPISQDGLFGDTVEDFVQQSKSRQRPSDTSCPGVILLPPGRRGLDRSLLITEGSPAASTPALALPKTISRSQR